MREVRNQLLNNALDALDRLYDSQSGMIDIYAITYATARALPEDSMFSLLNETATALSELLRCKLTQREAQESALKITGSLRIALALELQQTLI